MGSGGWDAICWGQDLAQNFLGLGPAPKVLGEKGMAPQPFRGGRRRLLNYLGPEKVAPQTLGSGLYWGQWRGIQPVGIGGRAGPTVAGVQR